MRIAVPMLLAFWIGLAGAVSAQADPDGIRAVPGFWGQFALEIDLPRKVPYRVIPLSTPDRIVIDLKTPDFEAGPSSLPAPVRTHRAGALFGGWSRIVLDLDTPLDLTSGSYIDGAPATLRLEFAKTPRAAFEEQAAIASRLPLPEAARRALSPGDVDLPLILLDPGHGGVDPGALAFGLSEKEIVLDVSRELARALEDTGLFRVRLTRDTDNFLTLGQRVEMARTLRPALFLSVHANTVVTGEARGAVLYTRSDTASDPASAASALTENRADIAAGLPAGRIVDDITGTLMEFERPATQARETLAARHLVARLDAEGRMIASRPLRSANYHVLQAPDVPSLLIEIGFFSSPADRRNMTSPEWQRDIARSIADALVTWHPEDTDLSTLIRQ